MARLPRKLGGPFIFVQRTGIIPAYSGGHASGGISGLIAFYALKFPHAQLGMLMRFGFVIIPKWVSFPAWSLFLVWFGLQWWGVHEQIAGFNQVSSAAHVGGALTGFLLWLVWRKIELQPTANSPADTTEPATRRTDQVLRRIASRTILCQPRAYGF